MFMVGNVGCLLGVDCLLGGSFYDLSTKGEV